MNNISYCMFCHTTSSFGTTSLVYQGEKLKFCQKCRNQVLTTALKIRKAKEKVDKNEKKL